MRHFWPLLLLLAACGNQEAGPRYYAQGEAPQSLAEWRLLAIDGGQLLPGKDVIPYELNTPLFTDYALKLRTLYVPSGSKAGYAAEGGLAFPVGTIISKTFYYAGETYPAVPKDGESPQVTRTTGIDLKDFRLVETRLLVRHEEGWEALPYIWNDAQTDATLELAGGLKAMTLVAADGASQPFNYVIPDANQCAGCHAPNHTDKRLQPIGPRAAQLNRAYPYASGSQNQLQYLASMGLLDGYDAAAPAPLLPAWNDEEQFTVTERARAYLDANCAHCHNQAGPADTSGLFLDYAAAANRNLGLCKPPVAAGRGSGDRAFAIAPGQPDQSILVYRMEQTDPAIVMPELGRSVNHIEGIALVRRWIAEMPGAC